MELFNHAIQCAPIKINYFKYFILLLETDS